MLQELKTAPTYVISEGFAKVFLMSFEAILQINSRFD